MKTDDVRILDDELWEELISLTHGAAAVCYQCGVCTASCPWGLLRENFSVRDWMRKAQLGLEDGQETLWLCTACAQCEAQCPRGVPIAEVLRGLRYLLWKRRRTLEGLPSMLWSVYWNNNPWFQPPSQRIQWARGLDLPPFDPEAHELLLYVGCTSSYDRRAQRIARAMVRILDAAGVAFGVLGEDEPCCGEAVLSVGHRPYFEEIVQDTAGVFLDRGVGRLVAMSPHCYDVFRNEYPTIHDGWQPMHYTQLLAELIGDGRLSLEGSFDRKVTFQDPCFLGRRNREFEAPRQALRAVSGLELVEMANSQDEALCCGGGGGRMWMETPANERFADLRVRQAVDVEAEVIVTACPFCVACLEDGVKAGKLRSMRVMDVAEIVAAAIGANGG